MSAFADLVYQELSNLTPEARRDLGLDVIYEQASELQPKESQPPPRERALAVLNEYSNWRRTDISADDFLLATLTELFTER